MKRSKPLYFLLIIYVVLSINAFSQSRNKRADLIITNTTVADVINKEFLKHKSIVISDGHVIAITDKPQEYIAKRTIDGSHFIAMPGFIDTHTHLWQHLCKSCSPKESLQFWIKVYNDIHYLSPEQLYKVVLAASGEALLSGITSVSDYASLSFNDYAFEANAQAMQDAGLGGVIVYNNPSVFVPDSIKLLEIPKLQKKYKDHFALWMGYGPLSFYTIPQVYSGIAIGNQLNMNFSEHTMENNQEQRDFFDSTFKYYSTYASRLNSADTEFLQELIKMKRPSNVDAFQQLLSLKASLLKNDSILTAKNDTNYHPLTKDEKASLASLNNQRLISPLPLLEYLKGLNNFLSIHSVWPQQ